MSLLVNSHSTSRNARLGGAPRGSSGFSIGFKENKIPGTNKDQLKHNNSAERTLRSPLRMMGQRFCDSERREHVQMASAKSFEILTPPSTPEKILLITIVQNNERPRNKGEEKNRIVNRIMN